MRQVTDCAQAVHPAEILEWFTNMRCRKVSWQKVYSFVKLIGTMQPIFAHLFTRKRGQKIKSIALPVERYICHNSTFTGRICTPPLLTHFWYVFSSSSQVSNLTAQLIREKYDKIVLKQVEITVCSRGLFR